MLVADQRDPTHAALNEGTDLAHLLVLIVVVGHGP